MPVARSPTSDRKCCCSCTPTPPRRANRCKPSSRAIARCSISRRCSGKPPGSALHSEESPMKRFALLFMLMLGTAAVFAQAPKGWKMRVDRSASASDPDAAGTIKFMAMGGGFHFVNPQAAVFWNPSNTAGGSYTLKGTFTLMKPSGHTNYYGLVFGGSNLEGAQQ